MWTEIKAVVRKRPNFAKLLAYGFMQDRERYVYAKDIVDGTFCLYVYVWKTGETALEVIDKATAEEYTLAYTPEAVGAFVGSVRSACENALSNIVENCYEPHIFQSEYAHRLIEYVRNKYGDEAEYLWKKFPDNAIFRHATTGKWYGALLTVERKKLGLDGDGTVEIVDLKALPEEIPTLIDGIGYFAGYHMNKKHWYTVRLDGVVDIGEILEKLDYSYRLVRGK